jgi:hypothetical protein
MFKGGILSILIYTLSFGDNDLLFVVCYASPFGSKSMHENVGQGNVEEGRVAGEGRVFLTLIPISYG